MLFGLYTRVGPRTTCYIGVHMGLPDCWCGTFYIVEALSDIQIKSEKLRQMEFQTRTSLENLIAI